MPSYRLSPMLWANCCSETLPYLSSSYSGKCLATSAEVAPARTAEIAA